MAIGRPAFSVFLVDFPSDHEIDENLSTECQMIRAIIHNLGFRSTTKTIRISFKSRFDKVAWRPFANVGFVHLAGHGTKTGIGLIGGHIRWDMLADKLKIVAPRLVNRQQRVLNISTCYSEAAFEKLGPLLKGHFTGVYHFEDEEVFFSDSLTTWAMFYNKKKLKKPHAKVLDTINEYFEENVLSFHTI